MNRKTLSQLNPNAPQPHRQSMNPNGLKQNNRFSVAASTFQSTQQTQLKDPRSKKQIIDIMTQFLQQNNFITDVSKGISSNNFKQLVNLIMQPMDPHFSMDIIPQQQQQSNKNTTSSFDIDTLLNLFTFLKYPYTLAKRNLQSIGTMHTWPPVLAALSWLAELSNYHVSREHFEQQEQRNSLANQSTATVATQDELFLKFLSKAYSAFITSTDQDGKAADIFEQELEKQFEGRNEVLKKEIDKYKMEMMNMREELDTQYRNKPCPLVELKEQKEKLVVDKEMLATAMQGMERHNWKLRESGVTTEKEIRVSQQNIDALKVQIERLHRDISKQTVTKDEVRGWNNEIGILGNQLKMERENRERKLKEIHDEENLIRDLEQDLNDKIKEYHEYAAKLHLIPFESSKIAQQQQYNYELCIVDFYKCNLDMKQLKQNLYKVKQYYMQQYHQCKMEFQPLIEQLQSLEDELQEKMFLNDNMEKELKKLEQDYKNDRLNQRSEIQQKWFEIEQVEKEIQELKNRQSYQMEMDEQMRMLQQLEMEYNDLLRKYEHETAMMQDVLFGMFEFLTIHKQSIQDSIQQMDKKLQMVLDELNEEEEEEKEDEPM